MIGEIRWLIHNVIAHPLLGVASTAHRLAVWIHNATAPDLEREALDLDLVP